MIQTRLKRSTEIVCYHIVVHVTRITGMCKRNYGVCVVVFFKLRSLKLKQSFCVTTVDCFSVTLKFIWSNT